MTTETTVSKGQEFFSPGQTEGDPGRWVGVVIGGAVVVVDVGTTNNVFHILFSFEALIILSGC